MINKKKKKDFSTQLMILNHKEIRVKTLAIFVSILETQDFGTDVNFMDLGFDSIKLLELISIISEEFNVKLPLSFLFEYTTVDLVTEYLVKEGEYTV